MIYDCKSVDELVERMEQEVNDFIQCEEPSFETKPFLYEPILADFLKWISTEKFNGIDGEQLLNPKDYLTSNIDVLDLTSNKSTFKRSKNHHMNDVLDQQYDTEKLLKRVISERLHKRITKSTKAGDDPSTAKSFKSGGESVKERNWKAGGEKRKKTRLAYEEFLGIVQGLIVETDSEEDLNDFLLQINKCLYEIDDELKKMNPKEINDLQKTKYCLVLDVIRELLGPEVCDLVRSTCYSTKLSDLPTDLLRKEAYERIVGETMSRAPLEFPRNVDTIDVTNISAGMVVTKYELKEFFSSFKFLLLWAGFNNFQGTYDHRSGPQSSFLSISNKYRGESMLSTRVTNSEALQDRLIAIKYGAPTLRNILFSTLNLE